MGPLPRNIFCAWLATVSLGWCSLDALVVTGLTGNQEEADNFAQIARTTAQALEKRGGKVEILGPKFPGPSAREAILAKLAEREQLAPGDEFWLVLLGHSADGRDGLPTFQIKGPRLPAADLGAALAKVPAQTKFVFVGTENSGGYLEALRAAKCDVLTATQESGEISATRLPGHWADALEEHPTESVKFLAAQAAASLESEMANLGLARPEHARLLEAATGQILDPPFGLDDLTKLAGQPGPAPRSITPGYDPANIEIPKAEGNELFIRQEPSEETKKILAEAKAAPNPLGYPAVVLGIQNIVTIDPAGAVKDEETKRIYLASEEGLDRWANWSFAQNPPMLVTKLRAARIILPDASSYILNPKKFNRDSIGGVCSVMFPKAQAGAVIELSTEESNHPSYALPMFYREFFLQDSVPVLRRQITLQLPKEKSTLATYLKNAQAKPELSETDFSKVLTWNFENFPAYEPLPNSPPLRESAAWLGVSSAGSWDDFARWYRHISEGAFEAGPRVQAKAKDIMAAYPERKDRIRAAFEFVSAFRYVAVELGVGGVRPRTPEQTLENLYGDCKDKANLLIALLRTMGIPADFVLVNRMDSTDTAFPGWQFNHAIAYVPAGPGQPEALWLDSTDTITPFGYLAPGNLGREGLVFEEKDAVFRKIVSAADSESRVTNTWTLRQDADGRWKGTLDAKWTGLADYFQRMRIKGSSPLQRRDFLQGQLTERWPGADFAGITTSNAADITQPMELHATVDAPGARWPGIDPDLAKAVSTPERDRDLLLNDGQPFVIEQRVRLEFAAPTSAPAANTETTAGEQRFSIHYEAKDARTVERVARCEIRQPRVAPGDYPAFRRALRDWLAQLDQPLPSNHEHTASANR